MIQRFRLRNSKEQEVARVLIFFEPSINRFVGLLFEPPNFKSKATELFQENDIEMIIRTVASASNIEFSDFVELVSKLKT